MLWHNHWLAMPGEVTEWWNFQSMMVSNTIGYIGYVVKRNVLNHIFLRHTLFVLTHSHIIYQSKCGPELPKWWCGALNRRKRSGAQRVHNIKARDKNEICCWWHIVWKHAKPMPLLLAQCPRQRDTGNQLQVSNPWMYCNNPWMQWNGLLIKNIHNHITSLCVFVSPFECA